MCRPLPAQRCDRHTLVADNGIEVTLRRIVDRRQAAARWRLQSTRDESVGNDGLAGVAAGDVGDGVLHEKGGTQGFSQEVEQLTAVV
jgi:hypothetical protein